MWRFKNYVRSATTLVSIALIFQNFNHRSYASPFADYDEIDIDYNKDGKTEDFEDDYYDTKNLKNVGLGLEESHHVRFVVAIMDERLSNVTDYYYTCTGAIISAHHILTDASCIDDTAIEHFFVTTPKYFQENHGFLQNGTKRSGVPKDLRYIRSVSRRENRSSEVDFDYCIVKVNEPFQWSNDIQPLMVLDSTKIFFCEEVLNQMLTVRIGRIGGSLYTSRYIILNELKTMSFSSLKSINGTGLIAFYSDCPLYYSFGILQSMNTTKSNVTEESKRSVFGIQNLITAVNKTKSVGFEKLNSDWIYEVIELCDHYDLIRYFAVKKYERLSCVL